jgi:serine phosphatase RsbU (regulator of sigma subunit)
VNGDEIGAPGSLPLGLISAARYDVFTVQLVAGDRLTFVSDGVVEAQSRTGELLGFERTRELSNHSSEEIARAAQEFGQQDDITVVTVEFKGVPCSGVAALSPGETVRPATA